MKKYFLETERLYLRKMTKDDYADVAEMLQDEKVMYAWEYTFEKKDIDEWINKNIQRYAQYNMGYFLLEDKSTGNIVGQAAITPDTINGESHLEIGYILKYKFQGMGYATEAAKGLVGYASKYLGVSHVIFEIRPENVASIKVAERLGAKQNGSFVKSVRGKNMEHFIYTLVL